MQSKYRVALIVAAIATLVLHMNAATASDVTVTAVSGPVTITAAGHSVVARAAAKLTLPIEIHTGPAGAVDLLQLGSTLHVGPGTVLVLPDTEPEHGPVNRILQKAGYVLYNIKSRKAHPLSVETPYLVSVVKGTMFTIAVEGRGTTVALMEGSLDISAPGVAEHVLLKPNESVHHAEGEGRLSVRPTAPVAMGTPGGLPSVRNIDLPDTVNASQMAQVARDFADAGAAVAPSQLLAAAVQAPTYQQTVAATAAGSTVSTAAASPSQGSGTSPATTTGASAPSGAGSTGSAGSSDSSSGSASSDAANSSGSSAATKGASSTPSLPSDSGTTTTGNCNGKNNGTGNGKCLGHSK